MIDTFSGGGGTARGALLTGNIVLKYCVDHGVKECETLRLNFGNIVIEESITDFIQKRLGKQLLRIDILHISFPCQPHSPANTRRGQAKNDFENTIAGYTVGDLIQLCKPRLVTFEQTSGLFTHHYDRFLHLIGQITWAGYSARWKVFGADEQGNAHARQRLILYAAW